MPKVSDAHLLARRQEILAAAARCFARTGFHRSTVHDVAAESGLSAGLIYRYFTDKDDMIAAIAAQWHDQRADRLQLGIDGHGDSDGGADGHGGAEAEGGDGREVLDRAASGYLGLLRSLADPAERQRVRLGVQIWAEALRAPQVHAVARQGVDGPRAIVADLVAVAQRSGLLAPEISADGLARVFVALYQGLALQTAWDDELDHDAFAQTVRVLLDLIVNRSSE